MNTYIEKFRNENKTYHAEMNAIYKIPKKYCKQAVLYVWRIHNDGKISLSKPCEKCQKLIKKRGIKNIFYTNEHGKFVKF